MERLVMAGTPMIDAPDMMLMSMTGPFDAISRDPDGIAQRGPPERVAGGQHRQDASGSAPDRGRSLDRRGEQVRTAADLTTATHTNSPW
jgi:hypothetical protein